MEAVVAGVVAEAVGWTALAVATDGAQAAKLLHVAARHAVVMLLDLKSEWHRGRYVI